jgi:hypothetical protein
LTACSDRDLGNREVIGLTASPILQLARSVALIVRRGRRHRKECAHIVASGQSRKECAHIDAIP